MRAVSASDRNNIIARSWGSLLLLAATVMLCVAVYWPIVPPLVTEWYEHENFSYAFLVPVISLYLIWQERQIFRGRVVELDLWGGAMFFLVLLAGIFGRSLGEPFIARVSLVLAVPTLLSFFYGWRLVRSLALPLGYLVLMVPPPYVIIKEVSYYLKMSDAAIASHFVQALGVPVFRDGYLLHLPNITLEVADVCSGVASLFAMVALGALYIYYLPAGLVAKSLLVPAIVVFPVFANLVRIILVAVSVYYYGPVMLGAFYHKFTGTFTFLLSLVLFIAFGELLRKKFPRAAPAECVPGGVSTSNGVARALSKGTGSGWQKIVSVALLGLLAAAVALASLNWLQGAPRENLTNKLTTIPVTLGSFSGADAASADVFADPGADAQLSRLYQSPAGRPVELFVGFRGQQFDANRLPSPKLIFPEGWEYTSMAPMSVPVSPTKTIDALSLLTRKGSVNKLVLFWYQVRGESFAGDFRNRWELLKGFVLHGRTDGAVIRLATPVGENESMDHARQRLVTLAAELYPHLTQVLPK